jgi:hypothetical protein
MAKKAKADVPVDRFAPTAGGILKPSRAYFYGVDGIGKTSFFRDAPGVVFIPTEDGCNRLLNSKGERVKQFPLCTAWRPGRDVRGDEISLFSCLSWLHRQEHAYKIVVIDTVDWAEQLAVKWITDENYNGEPSKFGAYGSGYKDLSQQWRIFLNGLDLLRDDGMQVVLLSHSTTATALNPDGEDYDVHKGSLYHGKTISLWDMTKQWCDLLIFMGYKIAIKKHDEKDKSGKAIQKKGGTRVCYSEPAAGHPSCKVRVGWELPGEFPLDYEVWASYINE